MQIKRLGAALARHTGQEEAEKTRHLFQRLSVFRKEKKIEENCKKSCFPPACPAFSRFSFSQGKSVIKILTLD